MIDRNSDYYRDGWNDARAGRPEFTGWDLYCTEVIEYMVGYAEGKK
jgi:hypothetical protein